jgi:hypothetical protein
MPWHPPSIATDAITITNTFMASPEKRKGARRRPSGLLHSSVIL